MSDETPHTNDGEGLAVADPNDFFVAREDDGKPSPVVQQIPGTDQALNIHPLTNRHLERWGDDLEADEPDDAVVAAVFEYALADFDGEITESMVAEDLLGYSAMPLLQAIKNASNYQAFLGYREQRMQMVRMLKGLDQEQMDMLRDLADANGKPSDVTS
jgi:hypothetical protein